MGNHDTLSLAGERMQRLQLEFQKESDRGCAVLVICLLEDVLQQLFRAVVTDPTSDALRNIAPPGRLKASIENARLLGILGPRQAASFHALVGIRNKFAHGVLEGLSFNTPEIASAVKAAPTCFDESLSRPGALNFTHPPRDRFLMLATMLYFSMLAPVSPRERLKSAIDTPIIVQPTTR